MDIETTGGSYRTSRIIEFAAIKVLDDRIIDKFSTLVNPGSPIPYHITNITGITTHDVADAPFFDTVSGRIHEILSGAIFIAHNVRFDYSFIKRQLEGCNISFNPKMLCSVRMSRALYPEDKGHSLQAIINRFNIPVASRHRAYDDAEAVWSFLKISHGHHGQEVFDDAVKKQLKQRSLPPNLDVKAFSSIPNTPGVYTFLDKRNMPIYIGKSITMRRRIMSHFAQDTKIDKEMKLSLNTHKISYVETSGELEALLLESQMIKEQLPLYNRLLRRVRRMYVIKAAPDGHGYMSVKLDFVDREQINSFGALYGVYASKMKARASLEVLQKTYELCPKLLGLENAATVCFKFQLKKCSGACAGHEDPKTYNARFEVAFERNKIKAWPYANPIVLCPVSGRQSKNLVIDNWNVIGEINNEEGCDAFYKPWKSGFDVDTYKILYSYLANKTQKLKLNPISYSQLEALTI